MRQSMLIPLIPLVRFTRCARLSSRPLLSLRMISTLKSNFSTRAQQLDEAVGAAKGAGLAKVEVPMYVLDMWKEEKSQLFAEIHQILAEGEKKAARSVIAITELKAVREKLRLMESFNVRGGLERITYQATTEGLIPSSFRGVQAQLDSLAKNTIFVSICNNEIEARRLRYADVEECRKSLYYEMSKHAHGNDEVITIRAADFAPTELAALISYYKFQDGWGNCLQWEVIEKEPEAT